MRGLARVLRGDGGEGGGDGLRAAVQDAQQLPVGPLAGGGGVAGVQGGGGLAEVAADVDVIDQDRDLQAAFGGLGLDGGDLLLVPVDEEDPLADALRVAAVGLVERGRDHVLDALGDRGRYPLVAGCGPGCALRRAGGAAMSSGSRTAGVKSATATISAIFLIPGCAVPSPSPAPLRCSGRIAMPLPSPCIMITSLSGRSVVRVAGAFLVEVVRPGGEVLGQPGELGAADRDPGAGLDDLLGLPEPAGGQVIGRQGPHPQGVRVIGQDPPGVGRVQVRLAAVAVGHPGDPDRPEDAGHAPVMARLPRCRAGSRRRW